VPKFKKEKYLLRKDTSTALHIHLLWAFRRFTQILYENLEIGGSRVRFRYYHWLQTPYI